MGAELRWFRVSAEVVVEVADEEALKRAALDQVDVAEFGVGPGQSLEQARAEVRRDVHGDVAVAVAWLADADAVIGDHAGTRVVSSSSMVREVNEDGVAGDVPDFAGLFPLCGCAEDKCDVCAGFQLTPRTALALWTLADILGDRAYDDVCEHGDEPITTTNAWMIFSEYPRLTWGQDAVWRRQAARAFDDLAGDLAAGRWPRPTCPGEEMALHLMLRYAEAAVADDWGPSPQQLAALPGHAEDYDWDLASEVMLQDDDILDLFDARMDGIEDPDSDYNRSMGMGDYRPSAWFRPFRNTAPRDGRRGFRR